MKKLLYIFIAVMLTGCTDRSGKAITTATTPYDSIMQADGYEALPLFMTRTGHITITLQVNGKPCVFLVDTGGGATLIDLSKKDQYGLEVQSLRDYAAGIGSASPLVRTTGVFGINGRRSGTTACSSWTSHTSMPSSRETIPVGLMGYWVQTSRKSIMPSSTIHVSLSI